ncbi:MAG: di-trans,poly-cis-decaprenylcistransferase [Campylobacteraceae bacterium]|nr:di-trans,poly-cis-decaprenylcistransferase [Campylobacteraceae bacterium]
MNNLRHVAIIMDGNGRWAKQQGKLRTFGHKAGAQKVIDITKEASKRGLKYLTLYAFSTENWKREKSEVSFLMKLLSKFLKKELKTLIQNNIKFRIIGDLSKFSKELQKVINTTIEETKNNTGMTQILAINYGSQDEITRAVNKIDKIDITKKDIEQALDTKDFCDVDLLIRTGGEMRLSNFLLWQSSYAELFFTKTLWPDFSIKEFDDIIENFKKRDRRYGGI